MKVEIFDKTPIGFFSIDGEEFAVESIQKGGFDGTEPALKAELEPTGLREDFTKKIASFDEALNSLLKHITTTSVSKETIGAEKVEVEFSIGWSGKLNTWVVGSKLDCGVKVKVTW